MDPQPLPRFESFEHLVPADRIRPGAPETASLAMNEADSPCVTSAGQSSRVISTGVYGARNA